MAGLQYNFFPTDFFYPRPPTTQTDTGRKAALPMQSQNSRDSADDSVTPASAVKLEQSVKPNSVAIILNQEQSHGRAIVLRSINRSSQRRSQSGL